MNFEKPTSLSFSWFSLAITSIFVFSLMLRFWNLGKFNSLVFDEVYYAKFANNYLTGTEFFNSHPPLSQYLIAIGIWIGSFFPTSADTINDLTGSVRSTFSYRWLNALIGSFIPLIVGAIAYQLTYNRSYTLIATLFAAVDGLFLVESRYALNNIYLVIFGLLGQLYFLYTLADNSQQKWSKLTLSGIFFGASAAIKWNGLGFLLGIYLIWVLAWIGKIFNKINQEKKSIGYMGRGRKENPNLLLNFTKINLLHIIGYLSFIPLFTYSLLWIPHLLMNPQFGFVEVHKEILSFHQNIGDGSEVHPYCSRWYSWMFMLRPIAYFYQEISNSQENISTDLFLPNHLDKAIYDVHALGNPILWWLSTMVILLLLLLLVQNCFKAISSSNYSLNPQTGIVIYLVVNYCANLLPWIKINRCTFLYHYMSSSIFSLLALAWLVDRCLKNNQGNSQLIGIITIILIIVAFIFWLPIYLGLPLSTNGYKLRMFLFN